VRPGCQVILDIVVGRPHDGPHTTDGADSISRFLDNFPVPRCRRAALVRPAEFRSPAPCRPPFRERLPMRREDIEFTSDGATVRGWLYWPDEPSGDVPAVVLAGGWCYVRELVMPYYA